MIILEIPLSYEFGAQPRTIKLLACNCLENSLEALKITMEIQKKNFEFPRNRYLFDQPVCFDLIVIILNSIAFHLIENYDDQSEDTLRETFNALISMARESVKFNEPVIFFAYLRKLMLELTKDFRATMFSAENINELVQTIFHVRTHASYSLTFQIEPKEERDIDVWNIVNSESIRNRLSPENIKLVCEEAIKCFRQPATTLLRDLYPYPPIWFIMMGVVEECLPRLPKSKIILIYNLLHRHLFNLMDNVGMLEERFFNALSFVTRLEEHIQEDSCDTSRDYITKIVPHLERFHRNAAWQVEVLEKLQILVRKMKAVEMVDFFSTENMKILLGLLFKDQLRIQWLTADFLIMIVDKCLDISHPSDPDYAAYIVNLANQYKTTKRHLGGFFQYIIDEVQDREYIIKWAHKILDLQTDALRNPGGKHRRAFRFMTVAIR